jgi:hypothetical protein
MREPRLYNDEFMASSPFSSLSVPDLEMIAAGLVVPIATPDDPDSDLDFAKRYAAILLRERS